MRDRARKHQARSFGRLAMGLGLVSTHVVLALGCSDLECGPGTVRSGDKCVVANGNNSVERVPEEDLRV